METKRIIRIVAILAILSANIGCDQISKTIVRQQIDYYEEIGLLNNHFIITKVENSGAFLSFGNALPDIVKTILLVIIPVLTLIFGIFYILTKSNLSRNKIIAYGCIIGGGIGNIFDRVIYGSVTDFLHFDFVIFRTGILNMADLSITIGVAIILFEAIFRRQKSEITPS